jgi:glycosyltransferase involved in cell wall biosynthesis
MTTVAILMGTRDGASFLPSQLRSLEQQTFAGWRLFASDDGSADATVPILSQFRDRHAAAKVEIRNGPRQGFVANFLSLACDRAITADYFAFADQDDFWEPDKLERALSQLERVRPDLPGLWCSSTRLIDEQDRPIGYSAPIKRKLSFQNALVQSIASANTMVFNAAARDLLAFCGDRICVPSHDWWLYLLTTASGGEVLYDQVPSVQYRMHPNNVIGSNVGLASKLHRVIMLSRGRFKHWTDLNVAALDLFRSRMTSENQRLFDRFRLARNQSLLQRQIAFHRAGVYRQSVLGNIGLVIAIWARRI